MKLRKTDRLLLSLLRLEITSGKIEKEMFMSLDEREWRMLMASAQAQGVVAVAYEAIELLPKECRPPMPIVFEWFGQSNNVKQHYNRQFEQAKELTDRWTAEGIRTMVFKGLAHSRYYPVPSHREFGDFDCYLFADKANECKNAFEKGNLLAERFGVKVDTGWYKHSKIGFKNLTVENHKFFTGVRSSKKAKELNDYMVQCLGNGTFLEKLPNTNILLPTLEVEGLFLLYHSQIHFLVEGIKLRHFLDWTYWIKENERHLSWSSFYTKCKQFGVDGFADVSNAIAEKYFGIKFPKSIARNDRYADKVIESVLCDDSEIYNRSKGRWYERIHLITNAFKYSWKFRYVAHCSIYRYLWNYIRGFVTRQEENEAC